MASRAKAVLGRCDVWPHYAVTSSLVCPMQALLQGLPAAEGCGVPVCPRGQVSLVPPTPTHEHRQIPFPYKDRTGKSRPRDAPEVDIHPHNIKMPPRNNISSTLMKSPLFTQLQKREAKFSESVLLIFWWLLLCMRKTTTCVYVPNIMSALNLRVSVAPLFHSCVFPSWFLRSTSFLSYTGCAR